MLSPVPTLAHLEPVSMSQHSTTLVSKDKTRQRHLDPGETLLHASICWNKHTVH